MFSVEQSSLRERQLLAQEATAKARAACQGIDIEAFWDEVFGWRIGDVRIPDPDFASRPDIDGMKLAGTAAKYLRDAEDYWFHVYQPQEGDTIVDIGAGRGEDVFAFSKAVGTEGRVLAIEPHPVTFLALRKMCEWNALTNVTTLNLACMEQPQALQIETLPVWESNYVRIGQASADSHPVEGIRFDDLTRTLGIVEIDFLKMNIEGAERFALPGCRKALERTKHVTVAAHDFRAERGEGEAFRTLEFVRETLVDLGFEIIARDADPRYYVPFHVHGVR